MNASIREADIPIEAASASKDAADVDLGLLAAWRGANGKDLVSNDAVAEWVRLHPNRFDRPGRSSSVTA
jgi:hypothetical protein